MLDRQNFQNIARWIDHINRVFRTIMWLCAQLHAGPDFNLPDPPDELRPIMRFLAMLHNIMFLHAINAPPQALAFFLNEPLLFLEEPDEQPPFPEEALDEQPPFPEEALVAQDSYHQRFLELNADAPIDLSCPITYTLMLHPVYHPDVAHFILDRESLQKWSKGRMRIPHPYTQIIVNVSDFKSHQLSETKIKFYLRLFEENYSQLCKLPKNQRNIVTSKKLFQHVETWVYPPTVGLLLAENSLALKEARRRIGIFSPKIVQQNASSALQTLMFKKY